MQQTGNPYIMFFAVVIIVVTLALMLTWFASSPATPPVIHSEQPITDAAIPR